MSEPEHKAAVNESAEEFVDKARLKSLFEAREEAGKAIREAPLTEYQLELSRERIPPAVIEQHVRSAVTAYVLECEPLFKNTQTGLAYWQNYDFINIELPKTPPKKFQVDENAPSSSLPPRVKKREIIGVSDDIVDWQNGYIDVTGVRTYLELPSPVKCRWTGWATVGVGRKKKKTEVTTFGVPRRVSEAVFRTTNKLLADLDIGLDVEKARDGEASYDYSDLI